MVYPQLTSGALAQFPVRKTREMRTVKANEKSARLADPGGEVTEWRLAYVDLIDAEAHALREFFEACEGTLKSFTFADPTENLLAWTENLYEAVWTKGSLLTVGTDVADPLGQERAFRLINTGTGPQAVSQTLEAPAEYVYCFSMWVRAATPVTVTMLVCGHRVERSADVQWRRISQAAEGEPTFGVEIPGGAVVEVFGFQAEAQPSASGYKRGTIGAVYPDARFASDKLPMKATGPGLHECTVKIIHANHL